MSETWSEAVPTITTSTTGSDSVPTPPSRFPALTSIGAGRPTSMSNTRRANCLTVGLRRIFGSTVRRKKRNPGRRRAYRLTVGILIRSSSHLVYERLDVAHCCTGAVSWVEVTYASHHGRTTSE